MFPTDQRNNTNHNASVPLALPEAHHKADEDAYSYIDRVSRNTGCSSIHTTLLVMGRLDRMLASDSRKGFDFVGWYRGWLVTPQHSLKGRAPVDLLGSFEGRNELLNQICMLESGVYA